MLISNQYLLKLKYTKNKILKYMQLGEKSGDIMENFVTFFPTEH